MRLGLLHDDRVQFVGPACKNLEDPIADDLLILRRMKVLNVLPSQNQLMFEPVERGHHFLGVGCREGGEDEMVPFAEKSKFPDSSRKMKRLGRDMLAVSIPGGLGLGHAPVQKGHPYAPKLK